MCNREWAVKLSFIWPWSQWSDISGKDVLLINYCASILVIKQSFIFFSEDLNYVQTCELCSYEVPHHRSRLHHDIPAFLSSTSPTPLLLRQTLSFSLSYRVLFRIHKSLERGTSQKLSNTLACQWSVFSVACLCCLVYVLFCPVCMCLSAAE